MNREFITKFATFKHDVKAEPITPLMQNLQRELANQKDPALLACQQLAEKLQTKRAEVHLAPSDKSPTTKRSVLQFKRVETAPAAPSQAARTASKVEAVFQNVAWTLPHVQTMLLDLALTYLMTGGVNAVDLKASARAVQVAHALCHLGPFALLLLGKALCPDQAQGCIRGHYGAGGQGASIVSSNAT
jgi:hypothetical protein